MAISRIDDMVRRHSVERLTGCIQDGLRCSILNTDYGEMFRQHLHNIEIGHVCVAMLGLGALLAHVMADTETYEDHNLGVSSKLAYDTALWCECAMRVAKHAALMQSDPSTWPADSGELLTNAVASTSKAAGLVQQILEMGR